MMTGFVQAAVVGAGVEGLVIHVSVDPFRWKSGQEKTINIYLNKHKKLYCCYVDYSKAFDTVSRTELLSKLLNNISGKLFQIIYNMYKSAKSCVSVNSTLTDNCPCMIGVRQRDNLSPLLFLIFLNYLKLFLEPAHDGLKIVNTLSVENLDQELLVFCKLYILFYADATVLLVESQEDLQQAINLMDRYCSMWKLNINVSKTKINVFSRGKIRKIPKFFFGKNELEVVGQYKYLGLIFTYNGKFTEAKKQLVVKGNRAMFL